MLFSIIRLGGIHDIKPAAKRVVRKRVVKAATIPSGSMVPYAAVREELLR